jgi:hypothetical protein
VKKLVKYFNCGFSFSASTLGSEDDKESLYKKKKALNKRIVTLEKNSDVILIYYL